MPAQFDAKTFNPEVFGKYIAAIPRERTNKLVSSRALAGNSQIKESFSNQTGTAYATIPFYGRISGKALNYDGNTDIEADTTDTYSQGVVVVGRANAWEELDFSSDITGGADFMANVARQISEFWEDVDQDTLLSILNGIFGMTGTENKLFVDNHTHDITAVGDGVVDSTTLNSGIQKASGDKKSKYSLAIMHSAVATNLENLNLLAYLKYTDANGVERDLSLATWNGKLVLIDDGMPVTGTGDNAVYTTYVLGEGAISYERIGAKVPYEMDRDPKTRGGKTILYGRQRNVMAPGGISYTKKTQVSDSPTDTELENGGNWELVNNGQTGIKRKTIDHKQIPIARIISKG